MRGERRERRGERREEAENDSEVVKRGEAGSRRGCDKMDMRGQRGIERAHEGAPTSSQVNISAMTIPLPVLPALEREEDVASALLALPFAPNPFPSMEAWRPETPPSPRPLPGNGAERENGDAQGTRAATVATKINALRISSLGTFLQQPPPREKVQNRGNPLCPHQSVIIWAGRDGDDEGTLKGE